MREEREREKRGTSDKDGGVQKRGLTKETVRSNETRHRKLEEKELERLSDEGMERRD